MTPEEKNYIDAWHDVVKAVESIRKLTPQQQEQLAKDIWGTEAVMAMVNMMKQYFGLSEVEICQTVQCILTRLAI